MKTMQGTWVGQSVGQVAFRWLLATAREEVADVALQPGGSFRWIARQPAGGDARAPRGLVRAWSCIQSMLARRRQRQQLARLDDRLLDDIGVSRAEAQAEARRPWWR